MTTTSTLWSEGERVSWGGCWRGGMGLGVWVGVLLKLHADSTFIFLIIDFSSLFPSDAEASDLSPANEYVPDAACFILQMVVERSLLWIIIIPCLPGWSLAQLT
ncbi:hypothetical protein BaRGS_00030373 [Batillaria attramentaria]|uniref:Uncharacterized protein n=1 Tax=Batillaria attramentaria TaxID=370345 RepID=A0ABD0JTJ7_9CAEN